MMYRSAMLNYLILIFPTDIVIPHTLWFALLQKILRAPYPRPHGPGSVPALSFAARNRIFARNEE